MSDLAARLRPLDLSFPEHRRFSVRDLLGLPELARARLVAGKGGLPRAIRQVNVMQIPTERFAKPDELILASISAFDGVSGPSAVLISALAERGVTAMAVRGGDIKATVGAKAIRAADLSPLPLIELPEEVHLGELQTRVLKTIVTGQASQLELDTEVRERVASHVLEGGELDMLAEGLSEITGDQVAVVEDPGTVLSASSEVDHEHASRIGRTWFAEGWEGAVQVDDWVVWPVVAGRVVVGCIVARVSKGYAPLHRYTLEHGASVAALQMLHRREAAHAQIQLRTGFIEDLLGGWLDSEAANRRALALGWPVGSHFRALLARGPVETHDLGMWLRQRSPTALVTERKGSVLAVVPCEDDVQKRNRDPVLALSERLVSVWADLLVGLSARHENLDALPQATQEASEALVTARVFYKQSRVRAFEHLGLLRLLAEIPVDELAAFRDGVLRPLMSVDAAYRESLIETLTVLLQCNLNVAEAGRRGGWHYNTVRSRIARLSALLGRVKSDGPVLDSVSLALILNEELPNG